MAHYLTVTAIVTETEPSRKINLIVVMPFARAHAHTASYVYNGALTLTLSDY